MEEADGFRIEAAEQFGFKSTGDLAADYRCTLTALIAFAKACERKGRAEAAQFVRRELNNPLNAQSKSPLLSILGNLTKINQAVDAELAPIREAEESRFMTSQGYVRAPEGSTAKWAKPEPLCDDEGCPHHGTPHVCITRSGSSSC